MLEVELDIFSGMPNPRWLLSREEEDELVQRAVAEPAQVSAPFAADERFSLGYRGFIVREVKHDREPRRTRAAAQLPTDFRVGHKPAKHASAADLLLRTMERSSFVAGKVTDEVREAVSGGIALLEPVSVVDATTSLATPPPHDAIDEDVLARAHKPGKEAEDLTAEGTTWWSCAQNYFDANAWWFNEPAHVGLNNCYCFAANHRSDIRYARPGRKGGKPAKTITCADCTQGLYADGWKDGCDPNTLTIVMVMWPNNDYHFYRLVTGASNWWWGHKPGGTPAKYTDDCGKAIVQPISPINCCRGFYTDFCGYFYQNNSTALVA